MESAGLFVRSRAELASLDVILYGTGGLSAAVSAVLERNGVLPTAYANSSLSLWGTVHKGLPVLSPSRASNRCRCGKGLIIVASSWYRDIAVGLIALGLVENVDFCDAVRFAIAEEYCELSEICARYANCHSGKRAFLIGNGPSLTVGDLQSLQGEICFAANKIYLAFEQTDWRPTYYCVCDPQVAINIQEEILAMQADKFLANSTCFYGARVDHGLVLPFFFRNRAVGVDQLRFATQPVDGLYDGGTVIYMMLQLAFFMGFREIFLLGVDHRFHLPLLQSNGLLKGGPTNHFHHDYRPPGEQWCPPDLAYAEKAFALANQMFKDAGGRIFNLSRKTELSVIPQACLESILG